MADLRYSRYIENLYTRGRHQNISLISLEQDLFYSNHIERRNVDYFVLLKIRDMTSLTEFWKRFCIDLRQYSFLSLYESVTDHFGYLIIDFISYYKYRCNSFNIHYDTITSSFKNIFPADQMDINRLEAKMKSNLAIQQELHMETVTKRKR
jgi:hypothetical protein